MQKTRHEPTTNHNFPDQILKMRKRFARKAIVAISDIWCLNRTGQFMYLFGIVGSTLWGILYVIPYIYINYEEWVTRAYRVLGMFIAAEVMINWFCMKFVSSAYNPFRHGTLPTGIEMGQNVYKIKDNNDWQNGNTKENCNKIRRDATSVSIETGSLMYVATEMPKSADALPTRTAYPYFSWTPCLLCNRPRPPRCHHCPICNTCVLKRDHHCFIAGACIGYRNLRHFIVFLFWASVACVFALIHTLPYIYYALIPFIRYLDLLFPIAIIRSLFGCISIESAFVITITWLLTAFLLWSISFLQCMSSLIKDGKTTFEKNFKMELQDTRDLLGKIRSVFGYWWIVNFIAPLHFVFEPIDDPVGWPFLQA